MARAMCREANAASDNTRKRSHRLVTRTRDKLHKKRTGAGRSRSGRPRGKNNGRDAGSAPLDPIPQTHDKLDGRGGIRNRSGQSITTGALAGTAAHRLFLFTAGMPRIRVSQRNKTAMVGRHEPDGKQGNHHRPTKKSLATHDATKLAHPANHATPFRARRAPEI